MKYFLLSFLISFSAFSQVSTPPSVEASEEVKETPLEEKIENVKEGMKGTREHRESSTGSFMLGYQFITTWLPSKWTFGYTQILNEKWSLEGEYSRGGISSSVVGVDLGSLSEERMTLQARRYVGNSFHFTFGMVYSDFSARVGSDILDGLGSPVRERIVIQSLGVTGGLGNRWQWSNGLTLGVDWIRMNIPVIETYEDISVLDHISSEGDKDDIQDVIDAVKRIPTFVLLGINVGYTF